MIHKKKKKLKSGEVVMQRSMTIYLNKYKAIFTPEYVKKSHQNESLSQKLCDPMFVFRYFYEGCT